MGDFGGFTKLFFSRFNENVLWAASTLGDLNMVEPRNGQIIDTFKGHVAPINDVVEWVTPEGQVRLVTAGDDNQCMVFSVKQETLKK